MTDLEVAEKMEKDQFPVGNGDNYERKDIVRILQGGIAQGRELERAAILNWIETAIDVAIERGDHIK